MTTARTCLWFDNNALEAARFYAEVLDDCEITGVQRTEMDYPDNAGERDEQGTVITVEFRIGDQRYVGLNGGPRFPLTEAVSIQVDCADQGEVDRLWSALTEGGEESQCGWLKDRFGLSWQIVPVEMYALMGDPDPQRAMRAQQAMMGMRKLDAAALKAAADGHDQG